ncbi:MAG TPA: hypothetical protein VMD59_04800 [Acidimicrobiales bacterium]|nr:hypothetical protein [Acidimicrobiales bacterium]
MSEGDGVWLAIAAVAAALTLTTAVLPAARGASPVRIVAWFLRCWAGRLVLLALWGEAGFHLLCQRP